MRLAGSPQISADGLPTVPSKVVSLPMGLGGSRVRPRDDVAIKVAELGSDFQRNAERMGSGSHTYVGNGAYETRLDSSTFQRIGGDTESMWTKNARSLSEVPRHGEARGLSMSGAGALSIRRFEVSRWRGGHRSFRLWVFNSEYSLGKR